MLSLKEDSLNDRYEQMFVAYIDGRSNKVKLPAAVQATVLSASGGFSRIHVQYKSILQHNKLWECRSANNGVPRHPGRSFPIPKKSDKSKSSIIDRSSFSFFLSFSSNVEQQSSPSHSSSLSSSSPSSSPTSSSPSSSFARLCFQPTTCRNDGVASSVDTNRVLPSASIDQSVLPMVQQPQRPPSAAARDGGAGVLLPPHRRLQEHALAAVPVRVPRTAMGAQDADHQGTLPRRQPRRRGLQDPGVLLRGMSHEGPGQVREGPRRAASQKAPHPVRPRGRGLFRAPAGALPGRVHLLHLLPRPAPASLVAPRRRLLAQGPAARRRPASHRRLHRHPQPQGPAGLGQAKKLADPPRPLLRASRPPGRASQDPAGRGWRAVRAAGLPLPALRGAPQCPPLGGVGLSPGGDVHHPPVPHRRHHPDLCGVPAPLVLFVPIHHPSR